MNPLDLQTSRYARQMRYAPLGVEGQRKLLASRALVVGCCNSGHDIAQNFYEQGANVTSMLTTANGGATTIATPLFIVGSTKASATFTLGSGEALTLTGTGATPRMACSYYHDEKDAAHAYDRQASRRAHR